MTARYHSPMPRFASRTSSIKPSTIREILELTQQPQVISFAGGLPAPGLFPVARIREAAAQVLTDDNRSALQYSSTTGNRALREWIAARSPGQVNADDVLIVSGSQQGLDLVGKLMIEPGDPVVVESPTYMGALRALDVYEPAYRAVATDAEGLDPAAVESELRAGARLIYTNPTFANPTGTTMSETRRREIVALVIEYDAFLYEDDPYKELRFEGDLVPTMHEMAPSNVIYGGSFSKILVPGFRLGWLIAPQPAMTMLNRAKQAADLHTSTFTQAVTTAILEDAFLAEHLRAVRAHYAAQRNLMLDALEKFFPEGADWTRPQGGMFIWVTAAPAVDTMALLPSAVDKGVAFVPGGPFHSTPGSDNTMRLSYSVATADQIESGIEILGSLL